MAYQDIERWKEMSKDELYQELAGLYDDMPPIDDITHIYVNNCYKLGAQVGGYANEFFVSLHPVGRQPARRQDDNSFLGDVYPWGRSPYKIEMRDPLKSWCDDNASH